MNISMTAVMTAFRAPPEKPEQSARLDAAGPATAAAAGLLALGLEAQLINKDTTMSNEVKQDKLAALSPRAKGALLTAMAEVEAAVKGDQIDAVKANAPDPAAGTEDPVDGAPVDAAPGDGITQGADPAQNAGPPNGGSVAGGAATNVAAGVEMPVSRGAYADPSQSAARVTDNDRIKGAMVDLRA